jgi:ribosome-binding factor A
MKQCLSITFAAKIERLSSIRLLSVTSSLFLILNSTMDTKRQRQVAELIKRNFSEVMQFETMNICGRGVLVTVTAVRVSPDLSQAKIYLSFFGTENKQEPYLMLQEEISMLKSKLAQRIKKHVRIIPEIALFMDDTIDEMYRVADMMKQLEADGQFGNPDEEED